MKAPKLGNPEIECNTGVSIKFTDAGTFLVSDGDAEALAVPESLVQRSGLLVDMRDQDDEAQRDVPVQLTVVQAKAWLLCAELGSDAELGTQNHETLLSALKVKTTTL